MAGLGVAHSAVVKPVQIVLIAAVTIGLSAARIGKVVGPRRKRIVVIGRLRLVAVPDVESPAVTVAIIDAEHELNMTPRHEKDLKF
jgi:hypothetical protein